MTRKTAQVAPILEVERKRFHQALLLGPLTQKEGVPAIADRSSRTSVTIAKQILEQLGASRETDKQSGQSLGSDFERICRDYLVSTFDQLSHLRPGRWKFLPDDSSDFTIEDCEQYAHLKELEQVAKEHPKVRALLGNDYTVKPDLLVLRMPEPDCEIDRIQPFLSERLAQFAAIRERVSSMPILHASISCKWTLRSDRAQNARTEALNLMRNRKGRVPHIAVVTAEPLPGRLASLALGTGDIDCVYHFALEELQNAVETAGSDDSKELLSTMVEGKRLKDISDLPLDLAI